MGAGHDSRIEGGDHELDVACARAAQRRSLQQGLQTIMAGQPPVARAQPGGVPHLHPWRHDGGVLYEVAAEMSSPKGQGARSSGQR